MRTRQLGQTELVTSSIGYGCDHMGGEWDRTPLTQAGFDQADRVVHAAHDAGINLFDLADVYTFGKAEQAFGKVLKTSPSLRDELVIQSKCGVRYQNEPRPGDPPRVDASGEHIISSVEGSLRRLQTDRLDILLLHIPDALLEPEEVAQAFDNLHTDGKVRYFGVSNHTALQMTLLQRYLRQPLVVNQMQISLDHSYPISGGYEYTLEIMDHLILQLEMFTGLLQYDPRQRYHHSYFGVGEAGTLDYCRVNDIQVQAWSPLRGGLLAPSALATPSLKETARLLAEMAKRMDTSVQALALAWLMRHPAGIVPVIGSSSPEHIRADCQADQVVLSREDWYALFRASSADSAKSRELP